MHDVGKLLGYATIDRPTSSFYCNNIWCKPGSAKTYAKWPSRPTTVSWPWD